MLGENRYNLALYSKCVWRSLHRTIYKMAFQKTVASGLTARRTNDNGGEGTRVARHAEAKAAQRRNRVVQQVFEASKRLRRGLCV
jgi:hypothetical protein